MTRQKKSRKPGSIAKKKSSTKDEVASKKSKKSKGLGAGSRNNQEKSNTNLKVNSNGKQDNRIGSKAAVPLIVDESKATLKPKAKLKKLVTQLTPEKELEQLEKDSRLADLMDKAESNKRLTESEQKYLDKKLNRYHQLCEELGLDMDDDEEDTNQAESGEEWQDLLDDGDQ